MYTIVIEEKTDLYDYIEKWLYKNYSKKCRKVMAEINNRYEEGRISHNGNGKNKKPTKRKIRYKQYTDYVTIFYKRNILYIDKYREKVENASELSNFFYEKYTIKAFFGKKIINKLLETINDEYETLKSESNKISIKIYQYGQWINGNGVVPKSIDAVILEKAEKEKLLKDIDDFTKKKQWYLDRGIPYKRGYLFHGPPGNGKTTLALTLAKHTNRDVYLLNLATVSDDSLGPLFNSLQSESILLIEDIDAVFEQRISKKEHLTFSTFLQYLDGALYVPDLIVIITTNHIEKLDPALIRFGRIDFRLKINNPNIPLIEDYLKLYYDKDIKFDNKIKSFSNNKSMSNIQDICLRNKESEGAINNLFENIYLNE